MSKSQLKKTIYISCYGGKVDRRKVKRAMQIVSRNCALHGNPWGPVVETKKSC